MEKNADPLATDHLMAHLGRRTVSGGAISVSAQVVKMAVQLGTMAILARLLAPEDFGLVAMAAAVTSFVGMFTDLGLSAATVQRKEIDQDTVSALFLVNLAMGVVVMAAVIALAPAAAWFFDDARVRWVVTALALPIPLLAASRQHAALLQRRMRWIAIQWTEIAPQVVAAGVAIFIAWRTDLGYWALVAQAWASAALTLTLLWSVCPWRPSRVGNWTNARAAINFGLHLTGFNVMHYVNRESDNVLIGWQWGAAELGYYSRAYALLTLPLRLINGPAGLAIIPALSRIQGEPERWRKAYLDAFGAVTLVSSGMTAVLIATAQPLVALLYGPGWSETASIFAVLAVSMFASVPMNATGWLYISLGRTKRMFQWSLIRSPILVGAFVAGLPFGGHGVAIGYSSAVLLTFLPGLAFAVHGTPVGLWQLLRLAIPVACLGVLASVSGRFIGALWEADSPILNFLIPCSATVAAYLAMVVVLIILDPKFRSVINGTRKIFMRSISPQSI